MGAEGSCRSPNGGGCPFSYALHIAKGTSFFQHSTRAKGHQIRAKRAKVNFFLLAFVFSRDFRRQKTAKVKIYFTFGGCRGFRCGSPFVAVVVSTGCRWCRVHGLLVSCGVCSVPLSLPFVPLLHFLSCISLEICLISHFKAVFRGFWGAGVYLYGFGALRGLCGFCTRVELGGLKAYGVFVSIFSYLLLLLSLFLLSLLVLLSSACPFSLCGLLLGFFCLGLLFLFPLRTIRKKERAQRFCPLCPLFVCCVC